MNLCGSHLSSRQVPGNVDGVGSPFESSYIQWSYSELPLKLTGCLSLVRRALTVRPQLVPQKCLNRAIPLHQRLVQQRVHAAERDGPQ